MSERVNPYKSITFQTDDFTKVDPEVEDTIKNLSADGYKYVSGPSVAQSNDGPVWVTLLFEKKNLFPDAEHMRARAEEVRQKFMNGR